MFLDGSHIFKKRLTQMYLYQAFWMFSLLTVVGNIFTHNANFTIVLLIKVGSLKNLVLRN